MANVVSPILHNWILVDNLSIRLKIIQKIPAFFKSLAFEWVNLVI